MPLSNYYLEYGRHVARLPRRRRRRRAYAPTSNTAAHENHEKISSWISFSLYGYGAPLVWAAGAPLYGVLSARETSELLIEKVKRAFRVM